MVAPQLEPKKIEPPPLPPEPPKESEDLSIESGIPTIERTPAITAEEYEARAARVAQDAARRMEPQIQWVEDYALQAETEMPPEEVMVLQEVKKKPKNLLQRFFDRIAGFRAKRREKQAEAEDVTLTAQWEHETKDMPPLQEAVEPQLQLSRPEKHKVSTEYKLTGEAARRKEIIDRAMANNDRAQLEYWLSILSDEWEAGVKEISAQTPTAAEKELYKQAIAGKADLRGEPTQLDYKLMDLQRIKRALAESAARGAEVVSTTTETPTRQIPPVGRKTSPETPRVRPRIEKIPSESLSDDETPTREVPKVTTAPKSPLSRGFETDEIVAATAGPKTYVDLAPPTIETPRVPEPPITKVDLAPPTIETPMAPEFDEQKYQKDRAFFIEEYANFEVYRQLLEKDPTDKHYQKLFDGAEARLDTENFFGQYANRISASENKKIADEVLARAEEIKKILKPYIEPHAAKTEVDLKPPTMEVPSGDAPTLPATPVIRGPQPEEQLAEYLTPAGKDLGAVPQESHYDVKMREYKYTLALYREQIEDQMQKIRDALEKESDALLTAGQKESLIKKLEALHKEHESLVKRIGEEESIPVPRAPVSATSEAPTVETMKAAVKSKTEKATPRAKRKPTTAPETAEAAEVRAAEKVRHEYVKLKAKLDYLGRKMIRAEATGRPTVRLLEEKMRTAATIDDLFMNQPQWRAELMDGTDRNLEEDIMRESLRLTAEEPMEPGENTGNANTA